MGGQIVRKGSKSGASAAEYALIVGIVGVAIIAGGVTLGQAILNLFQTFVTNITPS